MPNYKTLTREEHLKLLVEVAANLEGYELSDEEGYNHGERSHFLKAQDGSGKRIDINLTLEDGKVKVHGWSGHLYKHKAYDQKSAGPIGVAYIKGPQAIAREITRRFLPDYNAFYDELARREKADQDYHERLKNANAWLRDEGGNGLIDAERGYVNGFYGSIVAQGSDKPPEVKIDVRVPFAVACEIVRVLRAAKAKGQSNGE